MLWGEVGGGGAETELRAGRADCGAFTGPLMRLGPAYPPIWSGRGAGGTLKAWAGERTVASLVTAEGPSYGQDTGHSHQRKKVDGEGSGRGPGSVGPAEGLGSRRASGS